MKVKVLDLNGDTFTHSDVTEYKFGNHETFGLTPTLEFDTGKLLIVNANNYVTLEVTES